jgi:HK97 family phage major capsid protein
MPDPTNEITEQSGLGQANTPEQWADFVLEHLSNQAVVLASGATRVDTVMKQIHVPRVTSDGTVVWLDELEEIVNDRPEGDDLVLTPRKVGALVVLSNESVDDSSLNVLDTTGTAILRAIALEADAAIFHGAGGKQPTGILDGDPLPSQPGNVDYENIVRAAGKVRGAGGRPDVVYLNPADYTELQLVVDGTQRPLIQPNAAQGAAPTVAGLTIWPTPALEEGEALVAQADQIVVGIRSDATVAFSTDARFTSDGTVCRVITRIDAGVNDPNGLCVIELGS